MNDTSLNRMSDAELMALSGGTGVVSHNPLHPATTPTTPSTEPAIATSAIEGNLSIAPSATVTPSFSGTLTLPTIGAPTETIGAPQTGPVSDMSVMTYHPDPANEKITLIIDDENASPTEVIYASPVAADFSLR